MAALDNPRDRVDLQTSLDANYIREPPISTGSDDLDTGTDVKLSLSRKREREVSLEPATPQTTTLELDTTRSEGKERRVPAKKNRTSDSTLEAPQEEAEENTSANGSPPHETKIRQISQGVEDLTWQNMQKEGASDGVPEETTENARSQDEDVRAASGPVIDDQQQQTLPAEDIEPDTTQDIDIPAPPPPRGENPPMLDDTAGVDDDTGAAGRAEHPPGSHVVTSPPSAGSDIHFPESPRLPPSARRDSDSDQEKGLKRKLGDRTVSERLVPGEAVPIRSGVSPVGATKRPRDDPEMDANTREKKRPTPPPDENETGTKVESPVPQLGGFMAYASTNSPFASVPGPRIFGNKQLSKSSWASAAPGTTGSSFGSGATSPLASSSTSPSPLAAAIAAKEANALASSSTPHKRSGFEAFASVTSPFATAAKRSKSPPPQPGNIIGRSRSPSRHGTPARATSAFSAYASGGAQGFAAPTPKRHLGSVFGESSSAGVLAGHGAPESGKTDDEESEKDSRTSFGERLRASKDKEEEEASEDEKRLRLTEQEVLTGEEDEETVYQVRGKIFALSAQNQWKERGTGMLRLNVRRKDGGGARLIMRKEAVYTVILNATLFKGMSCTLAQDPRYLRFSVFEDGVATHYNLRVSNAKIAEELLEEIRAHIPFDHSSGSEDSSPEDLPTEFV